MERDPLVRTLLVLLVAAVGLHLAGGLWSLAVRFGDIILLFFLAWLIAFTLSPVAQFIMRHVPVPRAVAVMVVYLGMLFLVVVGVVMAVPAVTDQLYQIGENLPTYVQQTLSLTDWVQIWLNDHQLPDIISSAYNPQLLAQRAEGLGTALAQNALGIAQGVATALMQAVIVLILSLYMMLDSDRIDKQLVRMLPADYQADAHFFLSCIDRTFGGFMRGTLLQAVIYGTGTALVMSIAGINYVLAMSIFAGLAMIVPFVGTFLAVIPPLIAAGFTGSGTTVAFVAVALLLFQQVVINVIAPKVMSQAVGMHPLLVFLAMLVGVRVAGLWGAVFGVPVAGVLFAMAFFLYERALQSQPQPQALVQTQGATNSRSPST